MIKQRRESRVKFSFEQTVKSPGQHFKNLAELYFPKVYFSQSVFSQSVFHKVYFPKSKQTVSACEAFAQSALLKPQPDPAFFTVVVITCSGTDEYPL